MAGKLWLWSTTAANNATADPTVGWSEGQAPSSINDSARAMMASIASYRTDVAGSNIVGGTSTNYTLTTSQAFASAADMDGQEFTFVITPTNGAAATLNVNSIGAYPLVFSAGNAMPAGTLVDGSIYTATFSSSLSCFKVRSFFGNPYNIPIAGMMDWIAPAVPNSSFVFPIGQAISRTTYSVLFGLVGTTYGVGDGSTTFNVPDLTGRITAMKEASATRLTSTYFGGDSTTLGAVGGLERSTLVTANLPPYTPAGTVAASVTSSVSNVQVNNAGTANVSAGSGFNVPQTNSTSITSTGTNSLTGTAQGGTSTPVRTVQPTLIVNKILRII
jgi:microcystin-dependent protein